MAQICGDSSFDFLWERVHNMALALLQKAADSWATLRPDAPAVDAFIAVLYRVYLSDWPEYGGIRAETRDLSTWLVLVGSAVGELERLRPTANYKILTKVQSSIEAEMSEAKSRWTSGDPEFPPTTHVLNAIEHILFTHKLTRRPSNPKLPKSVIGSVT
jgi:hypothetical protein